MILLVGLSLIAALLTVTVAFGIARRRGRYDTIDSAWGAGFVVIAVVALFASAAMGRSSGAVGVVSVLLTAVWGVRLSVHIHTRNAGQGEDPRYVEMAQRGGENPAFRMFFRVYLTQALVMWFVSLPVQAAQWDAGPGVPLWLGALGVAVWALGFFFETVGDAQLRTFKSDPANEGKVLDRGLWRYTRHPNYFGDACVWWGLYLLACQHPFGVATVLAPVLMTWLLARGTGKPLLERHMRDKRPAYADYLSRTSGFFPLPPKRS